MLNGWIILKENFCRYSVFRTLNSKNRLERILWQQVHWLLHILYHPIRKTWPCIFMEYSKSLLLYFIFIRISPHLTHISKYYDAYFTGKACEFCSKDVAIEKSDFPQNGKLRKNKLEILKCGDPGYLAGSHDRVWLLLTGTVCSQVQFITTELLETLFCFILPASERSQYLWGFRKFPLKSALQ